MGRMAQRPVEGDHRGHAPLILRGTNRQNAALTPVM
jgi:hypothetical protein